MSGLSKWLKTVSILLFMIVWVGNLSRSQWDSSSLLCGASVGMTGQGKDPQWASGVSVLAIRGASVPLHLTSYHPVLSAKSLYIVARFQEPVTFLTDLSGFWVERRWYRGQGWEQGIQGGGYGPAMLTQAGGYLVRMGRGHNRNRQNTDSFEVEPIWPADGLNVQGS